jgi:hypothetical protein
MVIIGVADVDEDSTAIDASRFLLASVIVGGRVNLFASKVAATVAALLKGAPNPFHFSGSLARSYCAHSFGQN